MSEVLTGGTAVIDRPVTDETDGRGRNKHGEWYAVRIPEWVCSCDEIERVYMSEPVKPHRILVWPSEEDPNMKRILARLEEGVASVVVYEVAMGECISYYAMKPS